MYEVEATADLLMITSQAKPSTAPAKRPAMVPLIDAAMLAEQMQLPAHDVLVRAVLAGDREAFSSLYAQFAPLVHGILLARVPRLEVEDLVQDIFLHAYRKLHTLRNTAAFGPWIAMIARNRAMDFHRRSRETLEIKEEHGGYDRGRRERAEEILDVIRSLPEAYRETLVLRLVEGMTGPEIALRTGLTAASVRVNLHRGMKKLREQLGIEQAGAQP
jgi:RNA polymerase sigma-70 factor (ECF subfamily)